MDAPSHKEVVIAVLGAAAGLAGLVLVFEGVLIAALQAFPGDTPAATLVGYRRAAWGGLFVFTVSLASVAGAFVWLLMGCEAWYRATVALFSGQLLGVFLLAVYVTKKLMA